MSNIQTGAERMPHDLSHLGFLAGQIGRLITISTTPVDRKSGSAGMPRPISYAVFCLKKKNKSNSPNCTNTSQVERSRSSTVKYYRSCVIALELLTYDVNYMNRD